MSTDGYQLYEKLKNGEETTTTHNGETYTLKFVGEATGGNNYLLVSDRRGQTRRFGWGYSSEQCWRFLEHLERGWESEQRPPYRDYNAQTEAEGGVTY